MRNQHQIVIVALAIGLMSVAGCNNPPRNEGAAKSYRIESRLPDEGNRPGSADLVVATERAVEGIAAVPAISQAEGQTIIVMDRVDNATSDPTANFQIYLARIRALLNTSGARRNLAFVESRDKLEQIRQREGLGPATSRARPKYALTGTFYDLPRGRTNFHLLTFQLVDIETGVPVWEGKYEVKL